MASIYVNGVAIEEYGLAVNTLVEWASLPKRTYKTVDVPLRDGKRPVSVGSTTEPRAIGLKLYVQPTSFADRRAKLDALFAAMTGELEISTVENTNRVCYGYLEAASVTPAGLAFVDPQVYADCQIVCYDPLWYDKSPQVVSLNAVDTPTALPTGTARTRDIQIVLSNPSSSIVNPVLKLKDSRGAEAMRLTLTGTIATGERLVIDCEQHTITRYDTSNAAFDALSWLSGVEDFFYYDGNEAYTIEKTTAGTGPVYVRCAYLS